ncbi:NADPH-dependent F420 reductase [Mycolicibacterium fortuitum]|uniref:NADPH-dependent F420 reductase n=1 Tax=Mycolicibacterium fortuitum TaxID=1766 RepID=UPI001CE0EE93|nr:NAD(P)-binding domain-containing protein [Mycolicibacterium fortuitum]MCA4726610.1 NAD(P)-binding domain-containing protein [Mycolicibacterium fortuitum]
MNIGLIGSGHVGSAIATLAVRAGHDVVLSNSRGPGTLTWLTARLGPHATAASAASAAAMARIVVLAVPFGQRRELPVAALAGKVVIDAMNYYPARDGHILGIDRHFTTTSELVAAELPRSQVVKAFNSIYAEEMVSSARPAGNPQRRALPIAGDDRHAKRVVTRLIESFGFDVVDVGALAQGFRFENGTPAYCASAGRAELRRLLAQADVAQAG